MMFDNNGSESKKLWWWEKTRLIRSSARTFINALPLFVLWLTIPFVLLISNSLYQSRRLVSERNDRAQTDVQLEFTGENSENLTLHLSLPRRLRIEPDQPYDDAVTVWLTGTTMNTSSGSNESVIYTFLLSFEKETADFVDEMGNSIPGMVVLPVAMDGNSFEILHLKSNPASLKYNEKVVIVASEPSAGKVRRVSVPVETPGESRWRHFWDAVFSLPILIGGLLTAIAGFGLQQWKVLNDEEQRYKVGREDAVYARMQDALGKKSFQLAFDVYKEYSRDVETPNPRVKGLFDDHILPQKVMMEIKAELDKSAFSTAIELYLEYSKANIVGMEDIWNGMISQKFVGMLIAGNSRFQDLYNLLDEKSLLTPKIRKIWGFRDNYYYFADKMPSISRLRQLLRPWPEIIVYEGLPGIQDHADIKEGMDFLGITQNPFGSEKVEMDFLFANKADFVDKDANDVFPLTAEVDFDKSQFVAGPQGSGKTALALFMAGKSFDLNEKMSTGKRFPIYSKILLAGTVDCLLRNVAEILLHYYVKNPSDFLSQDVARQSALAVLLSNYVAGGSELMFRLQLAGLTDEVESAEFHRRLVELTKSADMIKLTEMGATRLLLQACPLEYKQILFLFDCQETSSDSLDFDNGIVDLIKELQHGRGVTVKIFSALSDFAGQVTDSLQLPVIKLEWDIDRLKDVLKTRMKSSHLSGLGFWFEVGLRPFSPDLLLESCGGTPGGLIRKGNEMLRTIGKNQRTINLEDAKKLFGAALVNKILKGA